MTRDSFHHNAYLVGVMLLVAFIPVSHFGMGLMTFLLFLNWIAEWNWHEKLVRLKQNRGFLVLSMLLLVICLGIIHANDPVAVLQKLAAKLVLFFAPVIVATTRPLNAREMRWVYASFVLATLFGCVWSIIYWLTHEVNDVREMSVFIDHIRFSLCVVLSILFTVHVLRQKQGSIAHNVLLASIVLLLAAYLFVAQTLTGILILFAIMLVYVFHILVNVENDRTRWSLLGVMLMLLLSGAGYVTYITYDYFHDRDTSIETRITELGGVYRFDETSIVENGHKIVYYVCEPELRAAWAVRSDSSYTPMLELTLIRYLNSKGMHKDYAAVMRLTPTDIRNVERGIANCDYTRVFGMRRALYPTFFSISLYQQTRIFDNSSLLQRVELWRMSWRVIQDNWILGVGLGNEKEALNQKLKEENSQIFIRNKQGSHCQFLTFWLSAGVLCMLYFVFVLIYPFVGMRKRITFLYVAFFLLIFMSCLTEDTLEVQTGCLLYAIFNPLLLMSGGQEESRKEKK